MMMTTTKPLIQIDDEVREMNAKEFAEYQTALETEAAAKVALLEKQEAKAALLDRLGITAEEAALLVG